MKNAYSKESAMIILAIIVLFAAAVILAIKYLRINVKALGRSAMQREASKRAGRLRAEDPMITCDYCGAKFNSSENSVCPKCGADFSKDEEWLRRFDPDIEWVQAQGDELADQALSDAKRDSAKTASKLKKVMIILGCVSGCILLLAVAALVFEGQQSFAKNEKLNEYSFDNYVPCEYQFSDGGVLLSCDGLTVTATLYENSDSGTYDLKIGYRVQNESNRNKQVNLDVFGINGLSEEYIGGWLYGAFRKNSDVTVYGKIYDWKGGPVQEMVFGGFRVEDVKSWETLYKDDGLIRKTTSAPDADAVEIPDGTTLYSNHGVDVILTPTEQEPGEDRRMFNLWIYNGTEYDYIFTATDISVNGRPQDYTPLYKQTLPAGYVFFADRIYAPGDEWDALTDSDRVEMSLSFSCKDHPEQDFSTGYLCLQGQPE